MFLGWLIRRQELDRKAYDAAKRGWETMQRRSAQIFLEERDRTLFSLATSDPRRVTDGENGAS
jgi:hypothetical protein